jgi:stalled ribosome rescue protein Dom34
VQLKLYLGCQQSKLVVGLENLLAKGCVNVITSLSECINKISDSLEFPGKFTSAESRRICSEFAMKFSRCAVVKDDGSLITHPGFATRDIMKYLHQMLEMTLEELGLHRKSRTKINYENDGADDAVSWDGRVMFFHDR